MALTFKEKAAHLYRVIQDIASDMRAVSRDRMAEDVRILTELLTVEIPEGGLSEEDLAEINGKIEAVEADLAQLREEFDELEIPPGFEDLTDRDVKILLNSLTGVSGGFLTWYNTSDKILELLIEQQNDDPQEAKLGYADYGNEKFYFLGDAPYNVKALKDIEYPDLSSGSYVQVYWQPEQNGIGANRLVGPGLPIIPKDFVFVKDSNGSGIQFQLYENNYGQVITSIQTEVEFINNTSEDVKYQPNSGNWTFGSYIEESQTFDHYSIWDYLRFYLRLDLSQASQNIVAQIRDENDNVIRTTTISAGQNYDNQYINQANGYRKLKLVIDYA